MKKLLFSTIVAVCAFAMTANAQFYAFGGASISTDSKVGGNAKEFGFSFTPGVGYSLAENFSVGLALNYERTKRTDKDNNDLWTKNSAWQVHPYARYKFAELGNFAAWVEGLISFGNSKNAAKSSGVVTSSTNDMNFAVQFHPILSYSLSEHFDLMLIVDFLSLGFYHNAKEDNSFRLGVDTYGANAGFIYKF